MSQISIYIPVIIVVLALAFVINAVKIVPQASEFIIERFGKYTKTLKPIKTNLNQLRQTKTYGNLLNKIQAH